MGEDEVFLLMILFLAAGITYLCIVISTQEDTIQRLSSIIADLTQKEKKDV